MPTLEHDSLVFRFPQIEQETCFSINFQRTLRIPDTEEPVSEQLEIFNASNHLVIQAIRNIDTESLTPIEALNELHRLKKLIE